MRQTHADAVFALEMTGECFRAVDGAVLAARAAERDLEVAESAGDVALHVRVHEAVDVVEEPLDLAPLLEEGDDVRVTPGGGFVTLVTPGVVHPAAVEDVAAAVAGCILGQAFPVGETEHVDFERIAFQRRDGRCSELPEDGVQVGIALEGLLEDLAEVLDRVGDALEEVFFLLDLSEYCFCWEAN